MTKGLGQAIVDGVGQAIVDATSRLLLRGREEQLVLPGLERRLGKLEALRCLRRAKAQIGDERIGLTLRRVRICEDCGGEGFFHGMDGLGTTSYDTTCQKCGGWGEIEK